MPFKSKSQQRFMYAKKAEGKLPGVDLNEWDKATDFKDLPEKKEKFSKLRKAMSGGKK